MPSRYTYAYYETLLTKVLELEPGDTKSLFRRALARWRLGDCEEASEDLETILKVSTLVS